MKNKFLLIIISYCLIQKSFSDINTDNPENEQPSASTDFSEDKDVDTKIQVLFLKLFHYLRDFESKLDGPLLYLYL